MTEPVEGWYGPPRVVCTAERHGNCEYCPECGYDMGPIPAHRLFPDGTPIGIKYCSPTCIKVMQDRTGGWVSLRDMTPEEKVRALRDLGVKVREPS